MDDNTEELINWLKNKGDHPTFYIAGDLPNLKSIKGILYYIILLILFSVPMVLTIIGTILTYILAQIYNYMYELLNGK
jgi:hypothetical protein